MKSGPLKPIAIRTAREWNRQIAQLPPCRELSRSKRPSIPDDVHNLVRFAAVLPLSAIEK
jgi:hypothetical protein